MRRLPLDELKAQMLYAIIESWSIQKLFDHIYEMIGLPMICFDPSFVVLAYSFQRPCSYCHWEWLAENGCAPSETVFEYDYLSYQEVMAKSKNSILFNEGVTADYPQACGAIFENHHLLGYCGIMQEDSDAADLLAATDMLVNACSLLLANEKKHQAIPPSLILSETPSQELLYFLYSVSKGEYLYSVIQPKVSQIALLQYILGEITQRELSAIGCVDSHGLLHLLYYESVGQSCREEFYLLLSSLAEKHDIKVGLSDVFSNPEDIPTYRKQATCSIQNINTSFKVQLFEEVYCKTIYKLALEYYGKDICLFPEIKLIADEDEASDTKLLETLDIWLLNNRRRSVTAELMSVTKNTVSARLERITQLIGRNPALDSMNLRTGLDLYKMICSLEEGGNQD